MSRNRSNSSNGNRNSLERTPSYEKVRMIVKAEGRSARNLVSWHVPINENLHVETLNGSQQNAPGKPSNGNAQVSSRFTPTKRPVLDAEAVELRKESDLRNRYWSFMFNNLDLAVDAIYETCMKDRSVNECKEAILILEKMLLQFNGLINFITQEEKWHRSDRPPPIAWEIRKTISPSKTFAGGGTTTGAPLVVATTAVVTNGDCVAKRNLQFDESREDPVGDATSQQQDSQSISSSLVANKDSFSVASTSSLSEVSNTDETGPCVGRVGQRTVGSMVACEANGGDKSDVKKECEEDGEWKLVQSRSRSRPSKPQQLQQSPVKASRNNLLPLFPKSVADIRQTKASLAKMQFNQRYIAQQREREDVERQKLVARPRVINYHNPKKGVSMPSLSGGAPPAPSAYQSRRLIKTGVGSYIKRGRFYSSYQSTESLCSLQSIKEDEIEESFEQAFPPLPVRPVWGLDQSPSSALTPSLAQSTTVDHSVSCEVDESTVGIVEANDEQHHTVEVDMVSNEAPVSCRTSTSTTTVEDDSNDSDNDTWQHLTEEEQSLAAEEEFLQREIEQEERKSIDIETSTQEAVFVDDTDSDDEETRVATDNKRTAQVEQEDDKSTSSDNVLCDEAPLTWQELVERWQKGYYYSI